MNKFTRRVYRTMLFAEIPLKLYLKKEAKPVREFLKDVLKPNSSVEEPELQGILDMLEPLGNKNEKFDKMLDYCRKRNFVYA